MDLTQYMSWAGPMVCVMKNINFIFAAHAWQDGCSNDYVCTGFMRILMYVSAWATAMVQVHALGKNVC